MPEDGAAQEPTVFVVDDDPGVCDSLRYLLKSVRLRVETFDSPAVFLERIDPARPGCLVLDVRMPGIGGLDLLAALRERACDLPVVFVSAHGSVSLAVRAMQAGATDFLEKPVDDEVLIAAVQRAVTSDLDRRAEKAAQAGTVARYAALSAREREVLGLLVDGLANKEVAARLGLSPKTVEAHRAHVIEKMGAGSLAELVAIVVRLGLR